MLFPLLASAVGKYRTSADQAFLAVIVFDTAAMITMKTLASALICTSYDTRDVHVHRSVVIPQSLDETYAANPSLSVV